VLKKVLNQRAAELEGAYQNLDWLEHVIAEKNELMIADGLKREQRIMIRDEIAQHQQHQDEIFSALPKLKQEFENALQTYELGKQEFSYYQ
jgi:phosphoenolpyruvate carboxylase